jgi:hypothetical protein
LLAFAVLTLLVIGRPLWRILFLQCEGPYPRELSPDGLDPVEFDLSILSGEPCDPPCWQGLVPGQTTTDEATLTLESLTFFDSDTIREGQTPTAIEGLAYVEWDRGSGELMLMDDVVAVVRIDLYYDLELHHLVERFGDPVGYFARTSPPQDAIIIGPICVGADVEYVWPEHGLTAVTSFDTRHPPRQSGKLFSRSDTLYVHTITYSQPASDVRDFLLARGRVETGAERDIDWLYQPWRGADQITLPAYYLD